MLNIGVGNIFGSWKIIAPGIKRAAHPTEKTWQVQCECGVTATLSSNELTSGHSKGCVNCRASKLAKTADMIGRRFGHLVVESQAPSRRTLDGQKHPYRAVRWYCRCDCGRVVDVAGVQLRYTKGARQCRPCARILAGKKLRLPDGVASRNNAWAGMRNRAKRYGRVWELDDAVFDTLIKLPCYYCGAPPGNKATSYVSGSMVVYQGIDRIDSNQGYTKENSVPCCGICNRWKSDIPVEEFKAHVKRIYENLEKEHD